jgi:cytochrome oxidase Cu insertion factor (SCO1/SenC/PrrC family)
MKKSIWMVIGILAVIVVAAHYADKATRLPHTTSASLAKPDAPGGEKPAPDVTLKDLDGKDVSIAQYKGKIVLVNFWATWCDSLADRDAAKIWSQGLHGAGRGDGR